MFVGICSLCLQCRRVSQARNQQSRHTVWPWRWKQCFPPKYWVVSELHSIIIQKTLLCVVTAIESQISTSAACFIITDMSFWLHVFSTEFIGLCQSLPCLYGIKISNILTTNKETFHVKILLRKWKNTATKDTTVFVVPTERA
jgi:hypothetical protein